MFRNLRFYRLDGSWPETEQALSEALENAAFEPCGPLTERSSGWTPVVPDAGDSLARRVNGADLVKLRSQSRVLPAAVIAEELDVRVEDYRRRMQEEPAPREKRRMKAEARDELLPKAMVKSDRIWGYVDIQEKILGIDSLQNAAAERFLRRLRAAFGDLDARPLQFAKPVDSLLTRIFLGDAPGSFALGRECRMRDASDSKSTVRWSNFDLSDTSIRNHVAEGMHLTHLGIVYDNMLNCVVDEDGAISKIKFIGMDDDTDDEHDAVARLDAEFVLLSGTIRHLLDELKKLLGGYA